MTPRIRAFITAAAAVCIASAAVLAGPPTPRVARAQTLTPSLSPLGGPAARPDAPAGERRKGILLHAPAEGAGRPPIRRASAAARREPEGRSGRKAAAVLSTGAAGRVDREGLTLTVPPRYDAVRSPVAAALTVSNRVSARTRAGHERRLARSRARIAARRTPRAAPAAAHEGGIRPGIP